MELCRGMVRSDAKDCRKEDYFKPLPASNSKLPLQALSSRDRIPKWVTDDAASETAQYCDIIMRRFCAQENAWQKAPMTWLCLVCRVDGLLIRRKGAWAKQSYFRQHRTAPCRIRNIPKHLLQPTALHSIQQAHRWCHTKQSVPQHPTASAAPTALTTTHSIQQSPPMM